MKPVRVTGITGQSSGRGTCVGPKVCHITMSWPSMSRSAAAYAGSPPPPGLWFTKSPAGYRCAGSYRVTHRARDAKPARAASGEAGSASKAGDGSGYSVNAVGLPNRLADSVLITRQTRPRDASPCRAACDSVASRVTRCAIALPYGLSGPIGRPVTSTSSTALARPSTDMSSRALNRCWCTGAPRPGATSVECGWSPPGWAAVNTTPVILTSHSIVPSR